MCLLTILGSNKFLTTPIIDRNTIIKNYLKDLEFIKNNMSVNQITISVRNGVQLQNLQQCHGVMKELVKHAHELGLKVSLHFTDSKGFYNAIFQTNNIAAVDQIETVDDTGLLRCFRLAEEEAGVVEVGGRTGGALIDHAAAQHR